MLLQSCSSWNLLFKLHTYSEPEQQQQQQQPNFFHPSKK